MYTGVHANHEPENIQATNCLTSMQEYKLQNTCCNFSTYTIGNTSKKHPTHFNACYLHHRLQNNANLRQELDKIAPCLSPVISLKKQRLSSK